jgi:hypothetical protein
MYLFEVRRFKKLTGIKQDKEVVFDPSKSFDKSTPASVHRVRGGLDSIFGNSHNAENRVDGAANGTTADIDNNGPRLFVVGSAFEIEE